MDAVSLGLVLSHSRRLLPSTLHAHLDVPVTLSQPPGLALWAPDPVHLVVTILFQFR
jgi:hypothetical protein